jgi:MscS family membrane protein
MFETLAAKDRSDRERTTYMDSARDTMMTFQSAARSGELDRAARCLDLSDIHASARADLGTVLAFKLKYVLDRVGRVYVQEIPEDPEGPRFVVYHGKIGRVVISRRTEDPGKGQWLFPPETVEQIEPMFRAVLQGKTEEGAELAEERLQQASIWETPGIWLRLKLPSSLRRPAGFLDLYQWLGLGLSCVLSLLTAYYFLAPLRRLVSWTLKKCGSALSAGFVAKMLQPLTWLSAVWILFHVLAWLDLPVGLANELLPLKKFCLAGLIGWFALRLVDLVRGIYTNSELLRPHRNLGDMIVPVGLQLLKAVVMVLVLAYVVYQIGKGELLTRFLTGLGVAGLAASLAAQDALKSFFGTLMLIGERAFKIGDRILVSGQEGVVEQVGFRSTRLRTNEDSLMTIPNSTIATSSIDNMGMRLARRYRTSVLLNHRTPLMLLVNLRDQLKTWLLQHPLVAPQRVDVRLHEVTELGIEIAVNLFYLPKEVGDDVRFQEGVTCEILRLTETLGIVLASRLFASTLASIESSSETRQAA